MCLKLILLLIHSFDLCFLLSTCYARLVVSNYIQYTSQSNATIGIKVYTLHPDTDNSLKNGTFIPYYHPRINSYWQALLPADHSNIDDILDNPTSHPYPVFHINVSSYVLSVPKSKSFVAVSLPWWHVDIESSYRNNLTLPVGHLSVTQYFNSTYSLEHPRLSDLLLNPSDKPLPFWHPTISDYVQYQTEPVISLGVEVYTIHPDIHLSLQNGHMIPAHHPNLSKYWAPFLPENHITLMIF